MRHEANDIAENITKLHYMNNNKQSNNFDKRPHHRLVIPCESEWIRPTLITI